MSTKEKLLKAALELFGEHGYAATSTRDICKKAGVNSASIGYHFGDKRTLYRAVLREEFQQSVSLQLVLREGSAEERLRQIVEATLNDVFRAREGASGKLALREITNPSEDLMDILKEPATTQFRYLLNCLEELASEKIDETRLTLCALSVIGQLQYYRVFHRLIPKLIGEDQAAKLDAEAIADHIVRFSIAALEKI